MSNVVEITADEESAEEMEEEEEDEEGVSSSSSSSSLTQTSTQPMAINNRHNEIKSHSGVPASSPPRRTTTAPQPHGTSAYTGNHSHQENSPTVKQHHNSHSNHSSHSATTPVVNTTHHDHHQKPQEKEHRQETSPTKDGETKQYSTTYGYQEEVFPENKKYPPILPPHLRYTPLNSSKKFHHDPGLLPIPLHVTVNHAYFAERDNMNKVGVTQRYKDKFCTVVLYKPKHTELKKCQNYSTN